jgi:hypothetical protein
MNMAIEPNSDNAYLQDHAALLLRCYRRWTQRDLIDPTLSPSEAARALYLAPFVVLSHDTHADPRFNYANKTAQRLFELPWPEIVGMPSRFSAEPLEREAREQLLARVSTAGYIDDYSGVRIAHSGKRFLVRRATVWNLFDEHGLNCGQAACFGEWTPVRTG